MPSAFSGRAQTYRALNWELESLVKKKFAIEHGAVGAYRWKNAESYSDWRVEVYWREAGTLRHRTLGKLKDILRDLRATEFVVD